MCRLGECIDQMDRFDSIDQQKQARNERTHVPNVLRHAFFYLCLCTNQPVNPTSNKSIILLVHSFIRRRTIDGGRTCTPARPPRARRSTTTAARSQTVLGWKCRRVDTVSQPVDRPRRAIEPPPILPTPTPPHTHPVGVGAPVALPLGIARVALGVVAARPVVVLGGLVVLLAVPAQPRRGRRGRAAAAGCRAAAAAAAAALCMQHPVQE